MALFSVSHLTRRGDVFYFRRVIPKALISAFRRRELKLSLGTAESVTARIRCRDMANAFERMVGEIESMGSLTQGQIEHLLRTYFEREWQKMNEIATLGPDDNKFDPASEAHEAKEFVESSRKKAIARQYEASVRAEARELLDQHGHEGKKVDLETLHSLCDGILRAQIEQSRIYAATLEGRFSDTMPTDPLFTNMKYPGLPPIEGDTSSLLEDPSSKKESTSPEKEENPVSGERLSVIFEAWKSERNPPAKTASEFSKTVRRFTELHGDVPAIAITKPMIREFKDALRKLPPTISGELRGLTVPQLLEAIEKSPPAKTLSTGSVNKDLGSLSAVLVWAGQQGYFDANPTWSNPVSGLKLKGAPGTEMKRVSYDAEDLKLIFNSAIFVERERPLGGGGEAAKWLPLLGLFTGARLEELGQALVSDIRKENEVAYLAITTEGGGKKLKSKTAHRRVPLHQQLIRLGFLSYVEERQKTGSVHLFPDLKPDKFGVRTGNWSKWWGRHTESIGITDETKVFHSLRHGFKTACRIAEIEEEIHDIITGHAGGGGVGRRYGKGECPLEVLDKAMQRVNFNVDLSHLLP